MRSSLTLRAAFTQLPLKQQASRAVAAVAAVARNPIAAVKQAVQPEEPARKRTKVSTEDGNVREANEGTPSTEARVARGLKDGSAAPRQVVFNTSANNVELANVDGRQLAEHGEESAETAEEGELEAPENYTREANPIGSHIYFYNNITTNRVIYSLYRHLWNNKALKQITFMGKKTVPAKIRKDMWTPFLTASFENPKTGLKTYHHLRELRKLHETQWDIALKKKSLRERSLILQDQRANSIADIAAIVKRDVKAEEKVRLRWVNIYDTEYAEEWPNTVVHHVEQEPTRYAAAKTGKYAYVEPKAPVPKQMAQKLTKEDFEIGHDKEHGKKPRRLLDGNQSVDIGTLAVADRSSTAESAKQIAS